MDGGGESDTHHGPGLVEEGEFKGWKGWSTDDFENLTGPFFYRQQEDGSVVCAFRAEKKHMNGGGAMHGGCMLTFADFCLFAISQPILEQQGGPTPSVTVSLNGDFVGPAFVGDLVEARGEVVRAGGSLIFVRGVIETGGSPMMTFSGVVKKIKRRAG